MNVSELRTIMEEALGQAGLQAKRLFPKGPKIWSLPADDIIRFFWPHAYRRPWGFVYSGAVGIEIPALRQWLHAYQAGTEGVFHSCFVSYLIVNEDIFRGFMVEHGEPLPAPLWAGLLKDRLDRVPTTLEALVATYRGNKEKLGLLADSHQRQSWDFMLSWHEQPDPALHVPKMLPNGRIA